MSANSSSPPSHRIGIIMSPVGRFLQCSDCKLSYVFPDEVQFGTLAKQFESHLCLPSIRGPAWRTDSRFVIVRYEGKVPAMLHACGAGVSSLHLQLFFGTLWERRNIWDRSLMGTYARGLRRDRRRLPQCWTSGEA